MTCKKVVSANGREIALLRLAACKLMNEPDGDFYRKIYNELLKYSVSWQTRGKLVLTFPAKQVFKFLALAKKWKEAKRWNG